MHTIATALDVSATRASLLSTLKAAEAVTGTGLAAKPIYSYMAIAGGPTGLVCQAHNGQVGLSIHQDGVAVASPGAALVPAHQLRQIVDQTVSDTVRCAVAHADAGGSSLDVSLADGAFSLPLLVGEEMPPVQPFPNDGGLCTVPGEPLRDLLAKTAFAVDDAPASAVLSGVLLEVSAGRLVLAATDGKILVEHTHADPQIADPTGTGESLRVVIPATVVHLLMRIIDAIGAESVQIATPGKLIAFRCRSGSITADLIARQIEGIYPAYAPALAGTATDMRFSIATGDLLSAIRRCLLVGENRHEALVATIEHGVLVLTSLRQARGAARITVPVSAVSGATGMVRFGFCAGYMLDILKSVRAEAVTWGVGRGLVCREGASVYLVMTIALPA